MYADEEEDKVSAKDRIFSSIKRRVANKPQIEVYEEDVEDEAFDEPALEEGEQVDMRQRLNFKVQSITDYLLTLLWHNVLVRFLEKLRTKKILLGLPDL